MNALLIKITIYKSIKSENTEMTEPGYEQLVWIFIHSIGLVKCKSEFSKKLHIYKTEAVNAKKAEG